MKKALVVVVVALLASMPHVARSRDHPTCRG